MKYFNLVSICSIAHIFFSRHVVNLSYFLNRGVFEAKIDEKKISEMSRYSRFLIIQMNYKLYLVSIADSFTRKASI